MQQVYGVTKRRRGARQSIRPTRVQCIFITDLWTVRQTRQGCSSKRALVGGGGGVGPAIVNNIYTNTFRARVDAVRNEIVGVSASVDAVVAGAVDGSCITRVAIIVESSLDWIQELFTVHGVQVDVASHRFAWVGLES